jgi:hypothetical protein
MSRPSELECDPTARSRRDAFHKGGQLFIRVRNETLSIVAMRVCNEDCPSESTPETQLQLQLALLRFISDDLPLLHAGRILPFLLSTWQ